MEYVKNVNCLKIPDKIFSRVPIAVNVIFCRKPPPSWSMFKARFNIQVIVSEA